MKIFFSTLILLFLFPQLYGQSSMYLINVKWHKLKREMQHRTDMVSLISTKYDAAFDKEKLKSARKVSLELFKIIDTLKTLDSITISLVSDKNTILTQTLSKALKNRSAIKEESDIFPILSQLEALENELVLTIKEYNQTCIASNRPDLLF